jgi:hypothetical protein
METHLAPAGTGDADASMTALAPSFVVTPEQIKARIAELQSFVKSYMREGEDYGTIPGTQKPTLYKPGAEKLCDVYGFTKEFTILERVEDWERGRFAYTVKATLRSKRTGLLEAEGLGSCNSMEARYRWLWVWENKLPPGFDPTGLAVRHTKSGRQYRVPNEDPWSQVNTILKMAKKRALVDAVLSATRSSGLFTQDLEDFAEDDLLDADYRVEPQPKGREPGRRPSSPREGAPERDSRPARSSESSDASSGPAPAPAWKTLGAAKQALVQLGVDPREVDSWIREVAGDLSPSAWPEATKRAVQQRLLAAWRALQPADDDGLPF